MPRSYTQEQLEFAEEHGFPPFWDDILPYREEKISKQSPGRPLGSHNRPDAKKTGRKPNSTKIQEHLRDAEIIAVKNQIIELMDSEQVSNLSQAAKILGISKLKLYGWRQKDSEWSRLLEQANQIRADRLEQEIEQAIVEETGKPITMPYVMARFFRLKSIRPEKYRDNFKFELVDGRMKQLLEDLKTVGQEPPPKQLPEAKAEEVALPTKIKEVVEAEKTREEI